MLLLVLSLDITKTEVEEVYKVNSSIRIGLALMWEVFSNPPLLKLLSSQQEI